MMGLDLIERTDAPDPVDDDAGIIAEAKARFTRCDKWEAKARANALLDARFANGDAYNSAQWDQAVLRARGDRPCLTHNRCRQHNLQIVNDAKQHKAAIKVTPTGGGATYAAAQVFSGLIRRIEYQSKAADAYSTAIYHQVETGIGYVRVVTDYADDDSFDQEIFVRRIANPRTVYLDPDAREYDKSDMNFGFVFNDIPKDRYDDADGSKPPSSVGFGPADDWHNIDHVREAEYWRRNESGDTLLLLSDGSTRRKSSLKPKERKAIEPYIVQEREISLHSVEWFRISGDKITHRGKWLGRYIPIVPFIGEEIISGDEMDRKGHTRALIDAQRMYNYWSSSAVEHVALQSKAPYVGTVQALAGYMEDWKTANVENHAVLVYNGIDEEGRPIPPPQRSQPPTMAQAYVQGMSIARDDMMMVSGQYQAEMGQPGNERSGSAINARQRQGDNATYHYIDNQAKGIRQVGRIILDLIPRVYDVARVMKVMGEDGSESDIHMIPSAPQAHQHVALGPEGPQPVSPGEADALQSDPDSPNPKVIFNPTIGSYGIEADVGPSYGTQRQEASNAFSEIMKQNPAAFQIVGDFWAQNSDFPGAEELAERLRKGLPPQYKNGPPPEVAQLQQQMQEMQGKFHELMQAAQQKVAGLSADLQDKGNDHIIKDYDAETRRLAAISAGDPAAFKVLVRSMLSEMLGMPALPIMHEHEAADAAHQQSIGAPPDGEQDDAGGPEPEGAGPPGDDAGGPEPDGPAPPPAPMMHPIYGQPRRHATEVRAQ